MPAHQPYDPATGHLPVELARADQPYSMPAAVVPAATGDVVVGPGGHPVRIVGYREYGGGLAPIYQEVAPVQATEPRDLSPQPLLDPTAQRMLAAGVGAGAAGGGIGWGMGQFVSALAGVSSGVLLGAAVFAAVLISSARRADGSQSGGPAAGPGGAPPAGGTELHFHRGSRVKVRNLHNHNNR